MIIEIMIIDKQGHVKAIGNITIDDNTVFNAQEVLVSEILFPIPCIILN